MVSSGCAEVTAKSQPVRVQTQLEQACSLSLSLRAQRLRRRGPLSRTWADGSVITEAIEDLAARGALCVLVEEGDAKAILQGGTGEIGVPVKEVSWLLPPGSLREPGAVRGRSDLFGWLISSRSPVCVRAWRRLDK